ncbi:GH24504 [Drosophila grimshawi]|uniref:GH24504 n=1 Tax=Drosophila grimshawi TaxID=7222 RepID=B4JLR7_DROGR|nr:GH24504 [Drosophila grimshawi]
MQTNVQIDSKNLRSDDNFRSRSHHITIEKMKISICQRQHPQYHIRVNNKNRSNTNNNV